MNGTRRSHVAELLLKKLQLLSLLSIHAKQVASENVLPNHGHDNRHKDVSPLDAIAQVCIDIGAVENSIVESITNLFVVYFVHESANSSVRELRESEDPLLDVLAQLLACVVKVVLIPHRDDVVALAVENLLL